MKLSESLVKIYPNETHPLTKVILVAGIVFIIASISFVLFFAVINITKLNNYLASLISIETTPVEGDIPFGIATSSNESSAPALASPTSTEENKKSEETKTKELGAGPTETNIYPTNAPNFSIVPGGIPDLMVQIIDTGIIDVAGNFIHATSTEQNQQTGIIFDVWNFGTAISGPWRFLVELPIFAGNFASGPQNSISPGEKIRFTIGSYSLRDVGSNKVRIVIDPQKELKETVLTNNTAEVAIIRNY